MTIEDIKIDFNSLNKDFLNCDLETFMIESNKIEGENELNPNDLKVIKKVYKLGFKNFEDILKYHSMLTDHLNVNWSGKWRVCNVRVGNYVAPDWSQVPELMAQYWKQFPEMDSWTAHNKFIKVHPFVDRNGRMARLIWLSKAKYERYDFSIPFLHKFYYQTLEHYHE